MKIYYLLEVRNYINALSIQDKTRLRRIRNLFETYGLQIGSKYIKKITGTIWELRAGKIRLFLCLREDYAYGVHVIYKKSQKLPLDDIRLAVKRSKLV